MPITDHDGEREQLLKALEQRLWRQYTRRRWWKRLRRVALVVIVGLLTVFTGYIAHRVFMGS